MLLLSCNPSDGVAEAVLPGLRGKEGVGTMRAYAYAVVGHLIGLLTVFTAAFGGIDDRRSDRPAGC